MTDYTNSPACALVASSCACCGRPLVDAVSVETGVGPDCRDRHGYDEAQGPADWDAVFHALETGEDDLGLGAPWAAAVNEHDAHKAANILVYHVAVEQDGARVHAFTNAIAALGYSKLAARITKRVAAVRIEVEGAVLVVRAPYSEAAVAEFRKVPGRVWDKAAKANRVPATSRAALWSALRKAYPGATATGPKGIFVIAA